MKAADEAQMRSRLARLCVAMGLAIFTAPLLGFGSDPAIAQDVEITKTDTSIDSLDPGIKLLVREKMAAGNSRFTDDNVILFLHGATSPSTCDFDLPYQDYSWADWLVRRGFVVYMGDYRNYAARPVKPQWASRLRTISLLPAPTSRCGTSRRWSIGSRRNAASNR
jgi:hypothetical protein